MDKPENPKSKVVKSKSSNSAIAPKPDCLRNMKKKSESRKKKSKSNGEFQTLAVTKQGVYVENKLTKISLNAIETIDEIQTVKPPPRPPAGSKRFLASVLAILSKSTTGTQHPDNENRDKKNKIKKKVTLEHIEATETTETTSDDNEKKKKPRYKSKVLNDNKYQVDKFEVLQSKREIIQTPSFNSERSYREDIKWSDLPRLVKTEDEEERDVSTHINNIVKEVSEGKKLKEKKVVTVVDPEPATIVSEDKEDKKLYNFFVDLLETTFNVYKNTENDIAPIPSAVSSHIELVMDESIARKLNVSTDMYDKAEKKQSEHFYCIKNEGDSWNDEKLINFFQESSSPKRINEMPLKSQNRKKKMQSNSFALTKKSRNSPPEAQSIVDTRLKSFHKRNKKRDLLHILKEQLNMDNYYYEEPQNLFQALKVIAKNKRKQKTIQFDGSTKKTNECMLPLKRRKVISPNTKSSIKNSYKNGYIPDKFSDTSGSKRNYLFHDDTTEEDCSTHSLEVYGFDYEVKKKNKRPEKNQTKFFRLYHSPSQSDFQDEDNVFTCSYKVDSSSTIKDFVSNYHLD